MFRFKQFAIRQTHAAMKVGTDGAMLGAWVNTEGAMNVLDIGTGTGIIAMMLAQRNNNAVIEAIEVDDQAIIDAAFNFHNCPWPDRIKLVHQSLQDFISDKSYDLIVSNPPYFENSLKSSTHQKVKARHTDSLHYSEIIDFAINHLSENGHLAMVLPVENAEKCIAYGKAKGFFSSRICKVKPVPHKQHHRYLFELSKSKATVREEELIIETGKRHDYTEQYIKMCNAFYTIM